jgi:NAD(P)-dependent dehydrogenase (short-subunit alcohol dehydrogenase family)
MASRAVVITGASTGIGAACAVHLAQLGFRVFAGVRKTVDGEALKKQASEKLTPLILDVTDSGAIAAAAVAVTREVGEAGIAGLVNNAGIVVAGPLEFLPLDELRKQLEVNTIGQVAVTQAFLGLIRHGRGRIVNIGSSSGFLSTPFLGPYCASKFAMEAITDALRMELAPWEIGVSIVDPGNIATPIWQKSLATADALASHLPAEALELYAHGLTVARAAAQKEAVHSSPPELVARAVEHALTAKRPRTRYYAGRDASLQAVLARFLPDRMMDRLIMKHIGL